MTELQHILKRTIHEEYEYDPAKLRRQFHEEFLEFRQDLRDSRWRRGDRELLSEEDVWQAFLIDLFEQHEGSTYGDELFGQIDVDYGIELLTRSEDD